MVKIFYTPVSFRNTTEFLFKEALKDIQGLDYSGILYLSPASIKTQEAQKILHRLQDNKCYIPPEMATIRQYCKKLYSAYGDKRMLHGSLIPVIISRLCGRGLGFSSMTADLMSELKQLYPSHEIDAIRHNFSDVFDELNIPESVSKVIMDSLDTFKEYQFFMQKNGLVDEEDVINISSKFKVQSSKLLILDGFYDLTTAEKNILKVLIQYSEHTLISIPYDSQFGGLVEGYTDFLKDNFDIEEMYIKERQEAMGNRQEEEIPIAPCPLPLASFVYCSYPGIEEEVEGIARNIKSLYVSGRFMDLGEIIVTFPDLNKYSAMVGRIFSRYGIPCSISKERPLGKMRPFLALLSLLGSVAEGYPRLKYSQFLSSRHFTKVPERLKKWMSTLSLQSGIVSGKKEWLSFIAEGSETVDMSLLKERDAIGKDMAWVFEKLEPLDNIKNGASFDTYVNIVQDILNDLGFLAFPMDSSMRDIRRTANELLEHVSFLGTLHSAPVTLSEFIDVLTHILNAYYIETEGTGVRVMDFSDMSGLSPEYIFFGGLTDGDMPERLGMDYLLPDSVKKTLSFLNLDKYIDIQRFCFYKLINSCKNMHLSYPLMDGDDMFLPSSFLYFGEEVRELIPGIFSNEEYLVRQGSKPFSMHISEIKIPQSSTFNLQPLTFMRVTDVDAYRMCPRKFFIERILNLSPADVKEYELEAATIGTIIHKIMEGIIKEPFENIEYLRDRAEAIIEESMKDKRIDAYWKRMIKDTFIEILPDIYEKELEIRKDGYISTEAEKTITGEPIEGIKLKGKVDRFDRIGDSVQIIDYKTGGSSLNCKQALEGNEKLQLFLYAAMMQSQGYKVNRVGIYSLKDIDIKWCPPKKARSQKSEARSQKTDNIDDYIIAALQFLEEAVKSIRRGDFKAKPLNDYICWNCHEYAFCPYIQQ